jgi:hypothetical protein
MPEKPKRRWLQFSLKGLMMAMLLAAFASHQYWSWKRSQRLYTKEYDVTDCLTYLPQHDPATGKLWGLAPDFEGVQKKVVESAVSKVKWSFYGPTIDPPKASFVVFVTHNEAGHKRVAAALKGMSDKSKKRWEFPTRIATRSVSE